MKTWYYTTNSLSKWQLGSIVVVEQPWYLFVLDWIGDNSCSFIPSIPFPNILPRKRISIKGCSCEHKEKHCDDHETLYTLKEWYGDFRQFWCGQIATPIMYYVFKHPKRKEYTIEVGYKRIKEIFYEHDKNYFDEQEKIT